MSYTSLVFGAFVLLTLLIYHLTPRRFRYLVLLAASYAFYVITCGAYVVYIIVTTISTYGLALAIEGVDSKVRTYIKENKEVLDKAGKKALKEKAKKRQWALLLLGLFFNFGILAVIKYGDFVIANLNLIRLSLFGNTDFISFLNLILPLGISFYTFQSMGYLIDVYFGRYKAQRSLPSLALFVSFFPQIIQGPISRYDQLSATLYEGSSMTWDDLVRGGYRILWGLFKKLVVADRVAAYVDGAMGRYDSLGGSYLLLAVFLYSLQIYGDFSGGIDITIGVSRLFGIRVAENFERPFFSKSVAEYWRRWHITLGTWFKDYIFYPITVSGRVLSLSKKCRSLFGEAFGKRVPIYLAMFVVWFATGLWHGAEWRYVIWGLLNFLILVLSTEAEPLFGRINSFLRWEGTFAIKCFRVFRTFWIMSFLRIFDLSSGGVAQALFVARRSLTDWCGLSLSVIEELGLDPQELSLAFIGGAVMLTVSLLQRRRSITDRLLAMRLPLRWFITIAMIVFIVVFGSYGMGYEARDFIYLQF